MLKINVLNGFKKCGTCLSWRVYADFHKDNTHGDGRRSKCKACSRQYGKAWEANRKQQPAKEHVYPDDFTKTCYVCKTPKDAESFSRSRATSDGLNARCKACDTLWAKTRKERDPEKYLAAANAVQKRLRKANPEKFKEQDKIFNRLSRLRNYQLTMESFAALLKLQEGRCAICKDLLTLGPSTHIDHDHKCCSGPSTSCGKCVRGILCAPCNRGLGKFKDSPTRLRAAADYLESGAALRSHCNPVNCLGRR